MRLDPIETYENKLRYVIQVYGCTLKISVLPAEQNTQ